MEAHVFDAGHLLLETHAAAAAALMLDFISRTQRNGDRARERRRPAASDRLLQARYLDVLWCMDRFICTWVWPPAA